MATIKCEGTDCKKKELCNRYTEPALIKWQAYLCMPVSVKIVDQCRWFVENKPE